ncbi:MAG: AI-2 transport protein TqsA [Flavobacteriales bacterium]|jgi:AI-2 transport protein TqsA
MQKFTGTLLVIFVIVLALIYGQTLLVPFLSALLLWIFVRGMRNLMNRVKVIREHIPSWIKTSISGFVIIIAIMGVSKLISQSVDQLSQAFPVYQNNVQTVTKNINQLLGIDLMSILENNAGSINYQSTLSSVFNALTDLLSNVFMIVLFALFLFLEERNFKTKMDLLFSKPKQKENVAAVLKQMEKSVTHYLGLKTLVSFITSTASYIALNIIGIDSPVFWAFLIFLLNYIPTIGSLIATLFPAIFCLLQFGGLNEALLVLGIVGTIQIVAGNIIEPKIMGNSLNISPLVAILSLSFWGILWGVTGMILSIPMTVIALIICSQFPQTRSVAVLLSEHGRL